jgi:hypothetical protein
MADLKAIERREAQRPPSWHGSPYDRGSADSWYRRPPQPHYYKGFRRIEEDDMLKEEVEAYLMGYRENEEANLHKDYR